MKSKGQRCYTEAELVMISSAPESELSELAEKLGRTFSAIVMKRWKLANPKLYNKIRAGFNASYYAKHRERAVCTSACQPWSDEDAARIVNETELTDAELSVVLGRSVMAIHRKRYDLRQRGLCEKFEVTEGNEETGHD